MNTLLVYAILLLAHVSVYFYFKNSFEDLRFLNFDSYSSSIKSKSMENSQVQQNENYNTIKLSDRIEDNKQILLSKSLKHLEFIANFEMYLDEKRPKNLPSEFVQEFEKIKIEAQLSTLKTTSQLSIRENIAA